MPRTLTALYETRSAADAARERLIDAGVSSSEIDVHDQDAYGGADAGRLKDEDHKGGLMAGLKSMFSSHEDHHVYAEGLNRGHVLLSATVDDDEIDDAVEILEGTAAVDLDHSQSEWRQSGWAGADTTATDSDTLQIAEERLVVGKRDVERGGVRVRSYIVERPVSEQVVLREETVGIERRPVNREIAGEDAFRDRSIEMRETGEEAVVGKQAFVTEEISLGKTVGQRTEEIHGTVRHTEVEVEQIAPGTAPKRL